MAVGRDVVGADGLTNAERYAKRQADKKARQAAFRAQQDAKKTTAVPSVSSPSSMFGSLLGAVQPTRSPAPAPAPAPSPVIRPVSGSATLSSSPISSASANEIVNPPELSDYLRNSGTEYGDWLKTIFDAFFEEMYAGPEFDVGDRNRTPDEVAEMKALLDRLNAGESVDLTEIAEDYPEFYTYIQSQYDLEGFDEEGFDADILGDTTSDDYRENQITDLLSSTIGSIGNNDDDLPEVEEPYSFIDEAGNFIEENVNDAWEWVVSKVEGGIDAIKDMTPQDWGDAVRTILEAGGIQLPTGDVQSILNGGYGVMWPSAGGSVGSPSGIFGTGGAIFIPGLPGGLNPGSVTIGTIQDILDAESIGDWATGVQDTVWQQVVKAATDPIGVLNTLYENGSLPGGLAGIVTAGVWGSEIVDWASGLLEEEETTTPPITSVEEEETEKEVPKTNLVEESEDFGTQPEEEETKGTLEETVEDTVEETVKEVPETSPNESEDFGTPQVEETKEEVIEEQVVDNGEAVEQGLTFGGGSEVFEQEDPAEDYRVNQVTNLLGGMLTAAGGGNNEQVEEQVENQVEEQVEDTVEENPFTFGGTGMIVEDDLTEDPPYTITVDPDKEEEVEDAFTVTPPVSSGSSASSARRQGMFDPVQYGINYQSPTVQAIIQSPQTDYMAPLNKIINKSMLV